MERSSTMIPRPFLLRSGDDSKKYTVFLSYGEDGRQMCDLLDSMLREANAQLMEQGIPAMIYADRWDHSAAQRVDSGHVNEVFVERAAASHLTIVLLTNEIRPGTREELEAVLQNTETQLAVIWFDVGGEATEIGTPTGTYLKEVVNERMLYLKTGAFDSPQAWQSIFKVVTRLVVHIASTHDSTPLPQMKAESIPGTIA